MTETDKKLRVAFAGRFTMHKLRLEFWRSGIIVQKNPLDQALVPGARLYSERKEGRKPAGPLHGGHRL